MSAVRRVVALPRAALLSAAVALQFSTPVLADWRALAALERDGALVSAVAVDLGNNQVIQSLNADTRLTPASLTKLVTASATLEAWPTDKMFQTLLLSSGEIHDGVLAGDLILRGAGDPSLDDHSLWELAAQIKGYDIHAITGRLIVSPAPFGSIGCGTKDRCEALRGSDRAYNAPVASIGIDFGNWCVIVRPTQVGREAQVRGCGVARLPVPVVGSITTAAAGSRQSLSVERETGADGDSLRVAGSIPLGEEQRLYRAMSDSARGVGLLLAETLHELGITTTGAPVVSEEPLPVNAYALAKTEGLTLREQVGRMLRFSNNYIADVLTLDLAASTMERPPTDLASAAEVLMQFMSRAQPGPRTAERQPPLLFSGSGLTVENRLSANDLGALLAYQYRSTGHFPAFYGGLTVPRDAPWEFMRGGSDNWLDRIAYKTGTMTEPVSVCGIAGYLRKRDGGWMAFAVIINGGPGHSHIAHDTAMRAVRTDLEEILTRN